MSNDVLRSAQAFDRSLLIVFDFDHTLINENSDLVPFRTLPYGQLLVPRFASLRKEQGMGWTQIMQMQLAELATQDGYSKQGLVECLQGIKMDPTLIRAIETLKQSETTKVHLVIASDANTVFIEEILAANGLGNDVFAKVYTNSGLWSADDVLDVQPYQPLGKPHGCPHDCPKNMCKTSILEKAKDELQLNKAVRLRTIYVGDGGNDFCPSLSLTTGDLVLVREGFTLQKLIEKAAADEKREQDKPSSTSEPPAAQQVADSTGIASSYVPTLTKLPRVAAQTRLWQTHEQLGHTLLGLVGESIPAGQSQSSTSALDADRDLANVSLADTSIAKESHI
jgi:pyridoxal phosphate phosphatase PHOSPHO2